MSEELEQAIATAKDAASDLKAALATVADVAGDDLRDRAGELVASALEQVDAIKARLDGLFS